MRIEEALFRHLGANAGVLAILGAGTDCKLFELEALDSTAAPYAVMELQADNRPQPLSAAPSAKVVSITFSCYGSSPSAADTLADAIYAALIEFSGVMGTGPTVQGCIFQGKRSAPISDYETTARLYMVELDLDLTVNL